MIRKATAADIPALVRMGRDFWSKTAYSGIPYCPDSAAVVLSQMMENGLLIVGEIEGRAVGMVGGAISPMFANRAVLAVTELFWWVSPEARNSRIGLELFSGLEAAAKEAGASVMGMIALDALDPEKAKSIYAARGYVPAEHTFMKFIGETWQQ